MGGVTGVVGMVGWVGVALMVGVGVAVMVEVVEMVEVVGVAQIRLGCCNYIEETNWFIWSSLMINLQLIMFRLFLLWDGNPDYYFGRYNRNLYVRTKCTLDRKQ